MGDINNSDRMGSSLEDSVPHNTISPQESPIPEKLTNLSFKIGNDILEFTECDLKPAIYTFDRDFEGTKCELSNLLELNGKRKSEAYEMLSEFFLRHFYFKTVEAEAESECYVYRGGIYQKKAVTFIDSIAHKILGKWFSGGSTPAILAHIKAQTYIDESNFYCKDPELVPVQNGILNVRTR